MLLTVTDEEAGLITKMADREHAPRVPVPGSVYQVVATLADRIAAARAAPRTAEVLLAEAVMAGDDVAARVLADAIVGRPPPEPPAAPEKLQATRESILAATRARAAVARRQRREEAARRAAATAELTARAAAIAADVRGLVGGLVSNRGRPLVVHAGEVLHQTEVGTTGFVTIAVSDGAADGGHGGVYYALQVRADGRLFFGQVPAGGRDELLQKLAAALVGAVREAGEAADAPV